ncbi:MAG: hypothetical protein KGD64_08540 [Candidatus Heimdallarchaeota archaeon]|nr:hypothetical protein [Candidatus Heimdallarchaeota archaeon]
MADIIQEILESGAILVINPTIIETDPDDFLEHYGHILDTIALVAKGRSGFTFYQSNSAPKDKFNGVFFHSFCTIADNMGIKVKALLYNHGDNFLAQNADFRINNNEGATVPSHACPSQEHFSKYIASIALEVAQYPIETLVLDDLMFPSKLTCFCDRCRRLFATKWDIERDFSFEFLESRELLEEWKETRATYINQTLREITDTIKNQKNIDIAITVKADRETGYLVGSDEYFGQNITELAKITNNFVIHVNPWSESFPPRESPEHQQILSSLAVLKDYSSSGMKYSLYFWNVSSTEKLASVNQMKEDLNAEAVFIEPSLPPDFTKRRTINLGF